MIGFSAVWINRILVFFSLSVAINAFLEINMPVVTVMYCLCRWFRADSGLLCSGVLFALSLLRIYVRPVSLLVSFLLLIVDLKGLGLFISLCPWTADTVKQSCLMSSMEQTC